MIGDDKSVSPPSNWSDLPPDLVRLIYRKLYDTFDFIYFRAVCKSWLAAAPLSDHPPQLPFILGRKNCLSSEMKLYSLHTGKTCRIQVPNARNAIFFGQSQGYLVIDKRHKTGCNDTSLTLLNPFTRAEVPFPFPRFIFCRPIHVISADRIRNSADVRIYMSMGIGSRFVGFWKYDQNNEWALKGCDGTGAFIGIQRHFHSGTEFSFEVYRLDEEVKPPCWVKLSNMGDLVIFLNPDSTGFCLSASAFNGISGNSIYFLEMVDGGRSLVGVYELAKDVSEVIGQLESKAIWIVPNVY
ncbi:uncharacterized protein LOC144553183 [Carex rostrata]